MADAERVTRAKVALSLTREQIYRPLTDLRKEVGSIIHDEKRIALLKAIEKIGSQLDEIEVHLNR